MIVKLRGRIHMTSLNRPFWSVCLTEFKNMIHFKLESLNCAPELIFPKNWICSRAPPGCPNNLIFTFLKSSKKMLQYELYKVTTYAISNFDIWSAVWPADHGEGSKFLFFSDKTHQTAGVCEISGKNIYRKSDF